jgi:hypothetical protein
MAAARMHTLRTENSTGCGCRILAIESRASSKPVTTTAAATASPDRYSMRPCPKGWSASAFFEAR